MMRTTINLPDDVYRVAQSLANANGTSLGEAVAELVRQALRPPLRVNAEKAFPCFDLPPDAEPITLEQTLQAEDEL
jgi:hypothetical protein